MNVARLSVGVTMMVARTASSEWKIRCSERAAHFADYIAAVVSPKNNGRPLAAVFHTHIGTVYIADIQFSWDVNSSMTSLLVQGDHLLE